MLLIACLDCTCVDTFNRKNWPKFRARNYSCITIRAKPVCALRRQYTPNWASVIPINMSTKLYGIHINEIARKERQEGPPRIKDTVHKVRGIHERVAHAVYLCPKRAVHSGVPSKPEDRKPIRRELPFFLLPSNETKKRIKRD